MPEINEIASWTIELNITCPSCKKHVDLTDQPEFWECFPGHIEDHLESKDNEVCCPECGHEFICDFTW